jgi:hypothetical protein
VAVHHGADRATESFVRAEMPNLDLIAQDRQAPLSKRFGVMA